MQKKHKDGTPYWEISRLNIEGLGKYDRFLRDQKIRISRCKTREQEKNQKIARDRMKEKELQIKVLRESRKFTDPSEKIELVGHRHSEYRAYRAPPALRGMAPPTECGSKDVFRDYNTPIQVHMKFSGNPILSVPLKSASRLAAIENAASSLPLKKKKKLANSIHNILFEESIKHHEFIDPWGHSMDERVFCPEIVFHGIKLKVSNMEK